MEALLGFDLDLWDYPTFLTLMLCVVALIATWLVLAGLLPTVYPRMQALIWAFKPTDIVDIRRFPREEAIATDKEIARLRCTPDSARAAVKEAQAVARCGSVVLTAFREVESALANEPLLARRAVLDESSLSNRTSAVLIATTQYLAGRKDLLWVSNLQTNQIRAEGDLIKLRALRHINPITLLLALGGSFAATPTVRGID
ncbi:MAG: hypothetical protein J0M13_04610 [Candidatus Accumulibacter sp.]|jgi:hypothetical protein|nr:hypothetical protein [Candidatus Accumulibacter necessarius]